MTNQMKWVTAGVVAGVVCLALAFTVGARLERPVCPKNTPEISIGAMSSTSEYAFVAKALPTIADQVASRAAESCGAIATFISTDRPEAVIDLQRVVLQPRRNKATSRVPFVHAMYKQASEFLKKTLLARFARTAPTATSPVLGTLAMIGKERRAQGLPPGTIIVATDMIAVEPGRRGKGPIDFRRRVPPRDEDQRLAAFRYGLAGLKDSHVIIVGVGADSHLGPERIEHAENAITSVLTSVGAKVTIMRSVTLPAAL